MRGGWLALVMLVACGRLGFEPLTETSGQGWRWQSTLTFDNQGREALHDFPVLVRLDPSRIDYALLRSDGGDLRFADVDDSLLSYDIEAWNPSGESIIWVRVPQIDAASTTDRILAVFGNPDATDASDPDAVWADYAAVYHLAEAPGAPAHDSSPHHNDGMFEPTMTAQNLVAGRSGPAITFDGIDDYIEVPSNPSLDLATLTIEGSVRPGSTTATAMLLCNDDIGIDTTGAYEIQAIVGGYLAYQTNNLSGPVNAACCMTAGTWYSLAVTVDAAAVSRVYLDASMTDPPKNDVAPQVLPTPLLIGRRGPADQFFQGELDELRLTPLVRSSDWVAAQDAALADRLITYGPVQPR